MNWRHYTSGSIFNVVLCWFYECCVTTCLLLRTVICVFSRFVVFSMFLQFTRTALTKSSCYENYAMNWLSGTYCCYIYIELSPRVNQIATMKLAHISSIGSERGIRLRVISSGRVLTLFIARLLLSNLIS